MLIAMAVGTALAIALVGCGATAPEGDEAQATISGAQYMVPNAPGSGYDTTARAVATIMEGEGIASGLQISNVEGAGGTVGLQRVINERGNGDLIMQMGLGVVGASYTSDTQARLADTTPIARLIGESGAIVVPADSDYQTIDDLVAAWRADPRGVSVGGGSNPGGPDHLMPMRLAAAVGIDPTEVSFVSYDGGGELLPAVLGGQVAFGASGFSEFADQIQAGELRLLAVTSAERVDLFPDVPTLIESGINLEFTNWRGVVAPPGITPDERAAWIDAFTRMNDSEAWQNELATRGWTNSFLAGDEFAAYLTEQDKMVADTLTELGLQ
ncbi:Bug family tripartite tricarboxylate transporter substrate binding protein [Naumannella huperziae]